MIIETFWFRWLFARKDYRIASACNYYFDTSLWSIVFPSFCWICGLTSKFPRCSLCLAGSTLFRRRSFWIIFGCFWGWHHRGSISFSGSRCWLWIRLVWQRSCCRFSWGYICIGFFCCCCWKIEEDFCLKDWVLLLTWAGIMPDCLGVISSSLVVAFLSILVVPRGGGSVIIQSYQWSVSY